MFDKKNEKILDFLFRFLSNANSTSNKTNDSSHPNDTMIRGGIITFYVFLFCAAFIFAGIMCISQCVESRARNRRNKRKKENATTKENQNGNKKSERNIIIEMVKNLNKVKVYESKNVERQVVIEIKIPDEIMADKSEDDNKIVNNVCRC